jgi:hypothetical protein
MAHAGSCVALLHVLATVDRDIGAGHEAGIVRAQLKHERRHFLKLVEAQPLDGGWTVLLYAFPARPPDCDAAFLLAPATIAETLACATSTRLRTELRTASAASLAVETADFTATTAGSEPARACLAQLSMRAITSRLNSS